MNKTDNGSAKTRYCWYTTLINVCRIELCPWSVPMGASIISITAMTTLDTHNLLTRSSLTRLIKIITQLIHNIIHWNCLTWLSQNSQACNPRIITHNTNINIAWPHISMNTEQNLNRRKGWIIKSKLSKGWQIIQYLWKSVKTNNKKRVKLNYNKQEQRMQIMRKVGNEEMHCEW